MAHNFDTVYGSTLHARMEIQQEEYHCLVLAEISILHVDRLTWQLHGQSRCLTGSYDQEKDDRFLSLMQVRWA